MSLSHSYIMLFHPCFTDKSFVHKLIIRLFVGLCIDGVELVHANPVIAALNEHGAKFVEGGSVYCGITHGVIR